MILLQMKYTPTGENFLRVIGPRQSYLTWCVYTTLYHLRKLFEFPDLFNWITVTAYDRPSKDRHLVELRRSSSGCPCPYLVFPEMLVWNQSSSSAIDNSILDDMIIYFLKEGVKKAWVGVEYESKSSLSEG